MPSRLSLFQPLPNACTLILYVLVHSLCLRIILIVLKYGIDLADPIGRKFPGLLSKLTSY